MGVTLTDLTPILKEVYEGGIVEQLSNETSAWNRVNQKVKDSDRFGGKYIDFPIHTRRNSGIGSRNEMEALPTAGAQGYEEAHVKWRHDYAAIAITGQAIELANTDYQAFSDALSEEKDGIVRDIAKERNRQFFGDGSGTRTLVTGAISGTTIPVADVTQLDEGGIYDIVPTGGGTPRGTVTVTGYDDTPGANTITVNATVAGVVATDRLVRKGSFNREINGLGSIINSTTPLYGIDPATVKVWRSTVHGNAASPTDLSELRLTRMADAIKIKGGKPSVMYTSYGVLRAYFALLTSQRRFVNTQKFDSGHSGLTFQSPSGGEVPFIADSDAPKGQIQFVDESQLTYYVRHKGYKFMDRTGSMWRQKVDATGTYDAWEATMYSYGELATKRRNAHGRIVGINEDAPQ